MVTERPSVLVVDDQPAMRLAMTRVLERAGYEVTRCEDGREALAALDARPWDAMVSDVRMPGVDGRELLGRALALRPALKVIMVTAFGTVEDAVEAIRRGAHDYLLKPFAPEALVAAVQRALAGRAERIAPGEAPHPPIVGREPRFADLLARVRLAAASDATVLLTGESGTGKEVIARLLHAESPRAAGPFVAVNCAALPGDLLEAELFGVCKGAFTGADRDRKGRFERACGGTLLLDEIGDLPIGLQAKLLRALEERVVVPLGGGTPRPLDLRLVAATHQDLGQAVADGRFRQDLYFRLSVIPLRVPALRERAADVALLAQHMAGEIAARMGKPVPAITPRALTRMATHPWPGNVRELKNVMERAVVMDRTGVIDTADLFLDGTVPSPAGDVLMPGLTVAEMERRLIERTLDAVGGNRTRASEMLGISVRTLRNKLRLFRGETPAGGVGLASSP